MHAAVISVRHFRESAGKASGFAFACCVNFSFPSHSVDRMFNAHTGLCGKRKMFVKRGTFSNDRCSEELKVCLNNIFFDKQKESKKISFNYEFHIEIFFYI